MTQLDEPSNTRAGGFHKPRGLANPKCDVTPVTTVIKDFIYEGEGSLSQSDDSEDDLEFPGDEAESLVRFSNLLSLISVLTHSTQVTIKTSNVGASG